eukprot:scaffold219579_cov22-Tisochrysis_lutea.AAC.1
MMLMLGYASALSFWLSLSHCKCLDVCVTQVRLSWMVPLRVMLTLGYALVYIHNGQPYPWASALLVRAYAAECPWHFLCLSCNLPSSRRKHSTHLCTLACAGRRVCPAAPVARTSSWDHKKCVLLQTQPDAGTFATLLTQVNGTALLFQWLMDTRYRKVYAQRGATRPRLKSCGSTDDLQQEEAALAKS